MKFKKRFEMRQRVQTPQDEESLTEEHHKDRCDINKIIRNYDRTGLITHISSKEPQWGMDTLSAPKSYQDAMNIVTVARESFEALPANVRKRFDNKPERFLEFIQNPENSSEAERLGIYTVIKPPETIDQANEIEEDSASHD